MSDIQISVIIPCYKQNDLLTRALRSVASQRTAFCIEVIVIDDGSPQPVVIESEKWPFSLTLVRQKNKGLASARNTGLRIAQGKTVKFLDADDELLPDCLRMQFSSIDNEPNAISIIGFIERHDDGRENKIIPAFGSFWDSLVQINIGPPHAYLFHREQLLKVGGSDTSERVNGGHEDYDLLLRLALDGNYAVTVHDLGVIYHRRSGSMSTQAEAMARTRVTVWTNAINQWLKQKELFTVTSLLAVLAGWIRLINVTPKKIASHLDALVPFLEQAIVSERNSFPFSETKQLKNSLMSIGTPSSLRLASALAAIGSKSFVNSSLYEPQEIIDRRLNFGILPAADTFYLWILKSMTDIFGHEGDFSLYGFGHIGRTLLQFLERAGKLPVLIIDRAASEGQFYKHIPIVTPDKIKSVQFEAIVIASVEFHQEIAEAVKRILPEVVILNKNPCKAVYNGTS